MKLLPLQQAITRRRVLRFNILLGLLVFFVSFYIIATGDFSSYSQSKSEVGMYNMAAIGGLLYSAFFWMYCMLSKPFWFPFGKSKKD
ncbi:MAG: hypothetical protein OEZ33_10420 [Gammaproteobacteria bacterium]|nr:hypothetical protein [Gammaproteobacteria bacterium]